MVQMATAGLLEAIFPELSALKGCRQNHYHAEDVFGHTLLAYRQMEDLLFQPAEFVPAVAVGEVAAMGTQIQLGMKLAILLHDIGKPLCRSVDRHGNIHFYGHPRKSAGLIAPISRRLRMSNQLRDAVVFIVDHHQRPLDLYVALKNLPDKNASKAKAKFFRRCKDHAPHILLHALADHLGKTDRAASPTDGMQGFIFALLETYIERIRFCRANPLINGNDLIRHFGLTPSPRLASILEEIETSYLAGAIHSREQALERVIHIIRRSPTDEDAP